MTETTSVRPEQRFNKAHPCPICGGYDSAARGQGVRCFGFLYENGEWARCTREEYSGPAPYEDRSGAYVHKLAGDCKCGARHGFPLAGAESKDRTNGAKNTQTAENP
jgi:hypothetical protein